MRLVGTDPVTTLATVSPHDRASPPTLRDLLEAADLRLALAPVTGATEASGATGATGATRVVLDDPALDRVVRWTHPTELVDPGDYLREGELVCTVGSALTDGPRCRTFARSLVAAGVAGLCFGVGDVHDQLPSALLQSCADLGLPVLVAPRGAPFSAISDHLRAREMQARQSDTRLSQRLVGRMLGGLRAQAPVATLLETAAEVMGGLLELEVDGVTTHRGGVAAKPRWSARTVPMRGGGVLRWTAESVAGSAAPLVQLAHVLEVAQRERDVEDSLRRERVGQLLLLVEERLLNPAALLPFLDEVGLAGADLTVRAWQAGAAALLPTDGGPLLVGEAPGVTLALSGGPTAPPGGPVSELPCGVSSSLPLSRLGQAVAEARAALGLATSRGGVVGPEGLTTLEGLLRQQPPGRLEPFVDQLLAPLVDSDRLHGTSHVQTLRSFLASGSLIDTARESYLHVNTVRHRLRRIQEITGRDPLAFSDRAALAIALWALDQQPRS